MKLIWLGVGSLNRTSAEIGNREYGFFLAHKKFRKCPALD